MFMVMVMIIVTTICIVGAPVCAIVITILAPVCPIILVMVMIMVMVMFVVIILATFGARAVTPPVSAYLTITLLARFTILAAAPQGSAPLCACTLVPGLVVIKFGAKTRAMMIIVFINKC